MWFFRCKSKVGITILWKMCRAVLDTPYRKSTLHWVGTTMIDGIQTNAKYFRFKCHWVWCNIERNTFRTTGILLGNPSGTSGSPSQHVAINADLWCFLCSTPGQAVEKIVELPLRLEAMTPTWRYLTHWSRDQIDAISQTTFSNVFSRMKMNEFRLGFHWSLFLRFELRKFQHWFR